MYVYNWFWLVKREKRKKNEWVGNSLKAIVLTATKDTAPCYCSLCGHMAEGLWELQFKGRVIKYYCLAHLVFQPKSFIQSCFVRWHHPESVSASVHTSPWHMVRHRNFILGTHMHICPPYMHIKYLMVLTCSF